MTITGRAYCPRCGARLRRGQPVGAHCDPCHRAGPDPTQDLPPDFFLQEPMRAALGEYDFSRVFLEVRHQTGWSQQRLGALVGLEQGQVSAVERGSARLSNVRLVAGIAQGLRICGGLLNFPDFGVTVSATGVARRKDVSWVDRRDFGQHIAGLILGMAGTAGLDIDRLLSLLPQAEPSGTRHIGVADVEVIDKLTAAFKRQDFAHGSGLVRDAAMAQLRTVLPLLNAQVSPEVRPRLLLAAGHLSMQAGYMSFDIKQHDAARRLWMIGLDIARETDHPLGADLTAYLLYDMASQAVDLGRPSEALHLTRIGHTAATGSRLVSGSTTCALANIRARAHAAEGDAAGCNRALGEGVEHFAVIDPVTGPPWGAHLDDTSLAAYQGAAHYTLAAGRDSRAAARAVPLLGHAVRTFGPGYGRPRALYLPDLAGAHALAGDADTAVAVGHEAVDAVMAVSSARARDRLRTLHTVLEPLRTSPGVADLRERLVTTAA